MKWFQAGMIIPVLLLSYFSLAQSGQPKFSRFGMEASFSISNVVSIIQDRKGFLWFGGSDGLYRYDGYKFQPFRHDPDNPYSVSDDNINILYEADDGFIWVGTRNGLNRFDPSTNLFDVFLPDSGKKDWITATEIMYIQQDPSGAFWIATPDHGLFKMTFQQRGSENGNNSGYKFTRFKHDSNNPNSLADDYVSCIYFDQPGKGWVCTYDGLCRFDPANADADIMFETFRHEANDEHSITANYIWRIYEDAQHHLWTIGNTSMLDRIDEDPSTKKIIFRHLFPQVKRALLNRPDAYLLDFMIDRKGRGWVSTTDGLYHFNLQQGKENFTLSNPEILFKKEHENQSLSSSWIWKSFEDHGGLIWLGASEGISQYNPSQEDFSALGLVPLKIPFQDLAVNTVFYDDENNLWLGGDSNCIWLVNKEVQRKVILNSDQMPVMKQDANVVRKILRGRDGTLYAGTDSGLFILDRRQVDQLSTGENFSALFHHLGKWGSKDRFPSSTVISMMEDQQGNIWIGTGNGVVKWQPQSGSMTIPYTSTDSTASGNGFIIRDLLMNSKGWIWMATDDGLVKLDPVSGQIKKFRNDIHRAESISGNRCTALLETTDGILWVGTTSGLNAFHETRKAFNHYTVKKGLSNDRIVSLLQDEKGMIWIGTQNGLSGFNQTNESFRNFFEEDGLNMNRFNRNSAFRAKDGLLFFGTNNGFIAFYPDSVNAKGPPPPVTLTDFKLFGQSILTGDDTLLKNSFLSNRQLKLNYHQNFFSFDFAALSFLHPEKNQYAFKLDGIDEDWVYTDQHVANYTGVRPGHYFFHVKGASSSNAWNEEGATFSIYIQPPWWQTWWFRIASLAVTVVWLWLAVRYYTRQKLKAQQQEFEKQRAIENVRTRISRDIHDEIGSGLTKISLMSERLKMKLKSTHEEEPLLEKISLSSRKIVGNLSEIIWTVNPKYDNLAGMLSYFRNYIAQFLEDTPLIYTVEFPEEVPDLPVHPDVKRNLFLVLKECLNNIVKHAQATHVTIHFEQDAGRFRFEINDDGVGIKNLNGREFGHGLMNMKNRIESVHGKFDIQTAENSGTRIIMQGELHYQQQA